MPSLYFRETPSLPPQIYGKRLMDIRRQNMLSTAKKLLTHESPLPLEAIALQSGFTSIIKGSRRCSGSGVPPLSE